MSGVVTVEPLAGRSVSLKARVFMAIPANIGMLDEFRLGQMPDWRFEAAGRASLDHCDPFGWSLDVRPVLAFRGFHSRRLCISRNQMRARNHRQFGNLLYQVA